MFQIKRKNLFYFLLFFFLLIKLSFHQSILFPFLNFKFDDDAEEEESKEKAYDDGLKPVYEKRVYTYNDNGTPVTVTQISYKSRNLGKNNKNKNLITPFEIMRNFDRRVNSIFEEFFKESIGIRNILSEMEKDEEEFEKKINKDFFGDDDKKNYIANDKNNEESNNNEDGKKETNKEKKVKKIGKLTIDEDKMKNAVNKNKKKKLSKRQLIFSRICKYVFYSIILFTIYIMVKKLLEFLEIIDPEGIVEVKINNEPDEEAINLKKSENKQN